MSSELPCVRMTGHKTPGESSEIRMRLLEGYSTLYTSLNVRVSRIGAKLVCLSITSKQAKVAPEDCYAVQGKNGGVPLHLVRSLNSKLELSQLLFVQCLTKRTR